MQKLLLTPIATLSIDVSRLKINKDPISQDLSTLIPDSGIAVEESDDVIRLLRQCSIQASVETVIQAAGDEITAEDIEDTDWGALSKMKISMKSLRS